jgi:hypothetical protein
MPTQTPQEKPGPLEPSSALISALPTEHYVLQSAISANTSEVGTRASLYLFSLSSSLVALGFASRSPELFVPFVAIVLPRSSSSGCSPRSGWWTATSKGSAWPCWPEDCFGRTGPWSLRSSVPVWPWC